MTTYYQPAQQQGYPQGYPPPQAMGMYPQPEQGYPPPQAMGMYPQPEQEYPQPQAMGMYPQPGQGYPQPQAMPGQGYPQPQAMGMYPQPGQGGYPPPQSSYPPPGGVPQPAPGGWIAAPSQPVNCPPGLEYLTMIDQLLVKQKVELLEALVGFEGANKYTVKNSVGQKVYYAVEDTDCCTRLCCGPTRPFDMKILDNSGNEIMHFYRPLRCQSCLFPCCLQTMEVSAPPGNVIGTITQEWDICYPKFKINNGAGETILKIEGPLCTWSFCGDVEFKVLSRDGGSEVGSIRKQWSGLLREAFTDADNFGISFPMDLDVNVKATLLGALFLIDFMFFEKKGNEENDSIGML